MGVARQDAAAAAMGHGWPVAACPHDSDGVREPPSLGEAAVRAEPVESSDTSNGYGLGIAAGASQNNWHTGYISGIRG